MKKIPTFFKDEYIDNDDEMMLPHMIVKWRIVIRMLSFKFVLATRHSREEI